MSDNSIWFHFTYDKPLEIQEFTKLLNFVDKSFANALEMMSIKNPSLKISPNQPTKILGVKEGSILINFLIEGLAAIGVEIIKSIAEILRKRLAFKNRRAGDCIYIQDNQINIHVGGDLIIPSKIEWNKDDEEKFVSKAVETYVKKKMKISPDEFIRDRDFLNLISIHGLNSLKARLQNIKAVFEELHIENSLKISGFSNYSQADKNNIKKYIQIQSEKEKSKT